MSSANFAPGHPGAGGMPSRFASAGGGAGGGGMGGLGFGPGGGMMGARIPGMGMAPPPRIGTIGRDMSALPPRAMVRPNGIQPADMQQSYNPSGDILAMLGKAPHGALGVNMGQHSNGGGLQNLSMHSMNMANNMMGLDSSNDHAESSPFDMNEFPALGGSGGRSVASYSSSGNLGSSSRVESSPELMSRGFGGAGIMPAGDLANNALAAQIPSYSGVAGVNTSGSSQQMTQNQQEFIIQDQDFPALPGSKRAMGNREPAASSSASHASGSEGSTTSAPASSDRFGMLGLLSVIRMTDSNLNMLALGTDLMTLGLNLNAADSLYETFTSPWSDSQQHKDDITQLPTCYLMSPPQLKEQHLQKFTDATLFYIFYHLHRDSHYPRKQLLQIAAQELFNRGWRYSQENNLWVSRVPQTNEMKFFDYQTWEYRPFIPDVATSAEK